MTTRGHWAISAGDPSYRPDIDGLRAIAVLLVVLYHVGVPGITGGFVGVDVFFVISGFLITENLLGAKERRPRAVILDFYARRARRILPSLTVVTLVTLALGWMLLLPSGEQQDLAKSAIASAVFTSNIFFWQLGRDYFAGPMELQPLLHTWSLSVEEQFYVLWPVLLLALWAIERRIPRVAGRLVPGALLAITAMSFALSIWWTATSQRSAFFLTPSRVWELGTGATLAVLWGGRGHRRLNEAFGILGMAAIAGAAVLYTPTTSFPGLAAALPVGGSALVVMSAMRGGGGVVYRALTSPVMLTTGRISYTWYLWHWPLLAVARTVDLGRRNFGRDLLLAGAAYVLAYLSTRFLETPIRQKRFSLFANTRGSLATGLALVAVLISFPAGLWAAARTGYRAEYARLKPATIPCTEPFINNKLEPQAPCILATGEKGSVFLIGDSFADHWSPAVTLWAGRAGAYAVERSFSACNILLASRDDVAPVGSQECDAFSKRVLQDIRARAAAGGVVGVVAGAAWPRDGHVDRLAERLDAALAALEPMHVRVVLIGSSPLFPFNVPACVARRALDSCRLARSDHESAIQATNAILTSVAARHTNVEFWSPTQEFCDATWCYPTSRGTLLFSDGGHISRFAAERATPDLAPHLDWLLAR